MHSPQAVLLLSNSVVDFLWVQAITLPLFSHFSSVLFELQGLRQKIAEKAIEHDA